MNLFRPITKYARRSWSRRSPPRSSAKAFKVAQTEKPGVCFIDFPEKSPR
jgi:thiamine pyrophosphate-dependent acetolactate synthase large subunit-like protein